MSSRIASITLAVALVASASISAAQAGMGNVNGSKMGNGQVTPSVPDVKAKPQMIDAKIKLNCYHTRERNELGVYVHRTHCG